MNIKPPSRPKMSKAEVSALIPTNILFENGVILVGIRGYYEDTMGTPGINDRGIYDDAIFVISPNKFAAFNANTDPSISRKGIAVLKTGVHPYKKGKHHINKPDAYRALRPATEGEMLPVTRDGEGDSMGIAINIHRGGYYKTSSEGCQTIYPDQYNEFIDLVYQEMNSYAQSIIFYVLVDFKSK